MEYVSMVLKWSQVYNFLREFLLIVAYTEGSESIEAYMKW